MIIFFAFFSSIKRYNNDNFGNLTFFYYIFPEYRYITFKLGRILNNRGKKLSVFDSFLELNNLTNILLLFKVKVKYVLCFEMYLPMRNVQN